MLSSVKSFVIAFAAAILIFGLIGYFIAPQIRSLANGLLTPQGEAAETDEVFEIPAVPDPASGISKQPAVFPGNTSFTLLLIGSDYQPEVFSDYRISVENSTDMSVLASHQRHYKADVVMLVRYNAESGVVMLSSVPSNLIVSAGGISMRLAEVLEKKSVTYFTEMVAGIVGLPINYYICCRISLFKDIIDRLGGIKYDVPVDMLYEDPEERIVTPGASRDPIPLVIDGEQIYDENGDPVMIPPGKAFKIDLKKGIQILNGEKASWALRYNSYANGFTGRRETQISFLRAFLDQFANETNHSKMSGIISLINTSDAGSTNMTASDFEELASTILNYSEYTCTAVTFPCTISGSGADERVSFSRNTVYATYEKFKIQ